jgi:D-amino-acid dehydrogenase
MTDSRLPIVVIGAGIVGVSCASYLLRDGHPVTLLDRDGPGEGASRGNAGALSPGSCVPLALPGVFRKIPGWLLDPEGPLTIRPAYLLSALPWLTRFSLAARAARVAQVADALLALHSRVFECYEPLVQAAGCRDLIRRAGTLAVYRGEAAYSASRGEWAMREQRGVPVQALDSRALRDLVPELSAAYTHGVMLPEHGHVADPHRLVRALAQAFVAAGGRLERVDVRGLRRNGEGTVSVLSDRGEVRAARIVLAAGAWSAMLARTVGLRLPLETQRGYQVTLADPGIAPRIPVTDADAKFYATPMEDGLRVAGTVEFAGLEAPPDFRRARRLLEQVVRLYPKARVDRFTEWMGHRPCLPDSLPAIGAPAGMPDVMLAFGHGHNGMTSGPVTGRLIADLVAGRAPFIDPSPYAADRF